MKLLNKVCVITGGNSGIGLAIAKEFAREGAKVVIFGREQKTLDLAVKDIGNGAVSVQGDVKNLKDIDRLYQATSQRFGKVDVVVAGAGIAKFAPFEHLTEELFDEVCQVNLKGAFFTVQKALPHLRDGASVIFISSAGATSRGFPLTSVYNATKTALRSLARTLSSELLPRRIRVNVLTPGATETPILTRDIGVSTELRDQIAAGMVQLTPAKRRATPEEIAKGALFLASDDSAYCLGSNLVMDGGLSQL
ncbi:MAG TPA: SDR family oxidoreductase [Verrucomicrobiae bacterium]|nr:SDR family oxidoreductase [Verrucomicrobiae bacterium]